MGRKDKVLDKAVKRKNYEASLLQKASTSGPGEESQWATDAVMEEACPLADVDDPQPLPSATEDTLVNEDVSGESTGIRRSKRRKNAKMDVIPNSAYLIADKYNISNRALMELAAAFHGGDIKDYNISHMTIQWCSLN